MGAGATPEGNSWPLQNASSSIKKCCCYGINCFCLLVGELNYYGTFFSLVYLQVILLLWQQWNLP